MRKLFNKKTALVLWLSIIVVSFVIALKIFQNFSISQNIIGMSTNAPKEFIPKDTKKIVYGFLPYWSIDSYNKDFSKITDLAYFTFYLDAKGSINKQDNSYIFWKKSKKLESIFDEANANGVRNHLTIAIHTPEDIDNFLGCKECYEQSLIEIRNEINSKKFINGVNFDFEYVGDANEDLALKYSDYIAFMSQQLKMEFGDKFMIVVSAYGDSADKPRITEPKFIDRPEIDYVFIMTYDYFSPSSNTAGPVSPLSGKGNNYRLDVDSTVNAFLKYFEGNQLILGIPLYGLNYIVENPVPYSTRIPGNDYTGFSVQQNLSDIYLLVEREKIKDFKWDEISSTPYFTYFNTEAGVNRIIFFENDKSFKLKIDLANKYNLKGIGFWALGYEGNSTKILEFAQSYFTSK